jgi:hypothetical protein
MQYFIHYAQVLRKGSVFEQTRHKLDIQLFIIATFYKQIINSFLPFFQSNCGLGWLGWCIVTRTLFYTK